MPGPVFFCFSRAAASEPEVGAAASVAPDAGQSCPALCRAAAVRSKARARADSTPGTLNARPRQWHYDLAAAPRKRCGRGTAPQPVYEHGCAMRRISANSRAGRQHGAGGRPLAGADAQAAVRLRPARTHPTRVRQALLEQDRHRGHDGLRIRAAAQQVWEVLQDPAVKGVLWGPGHSRILSIRPRRSPSALKPTTVSTTSPPLKNRSVGTARTE